MTDDTPPLVARVAGLDADLAATGVLAVTYLALTDGAATAAEIAAAIDTTPSTVADQLCGTGVVERRERELDNGGRNPYVYELPAETRTALDAAAPEWDHDSIRRRTIRELAEIHYERSLSSATASQLAREIPGASAQYVAGSLGRLAEADGPVEVVKRETPARYRLVGAGLYAPYQALPETAATDGGTDR